MPLSAIVFGGRRREDGSAGLPVQSWNNGVFVGSIMARETTAAAAGAVGVVRRDPMAMRPFCGYNMGDYFKHWIEMGEILGDKPPKIFNVNWFRVDDEGHFIWPGFGDNMRVLEWMLKRCDGEVDAVETAIGYVPKAEDINLEGSTISRSRPSRACSKSTTTRGRRKRRASKSSTRSSGTSSRQNSSRARRPQGARSGVSASQP